MKRAFLLVCATLLTCVVMAEDNTDHPLVGRFTGSSVSHQEISQFGRYEILVAPEETEVIEGEVWMTLYRGPDDSSTFTIYTTYLEFLEAEGYTLLVSCAPGECGDNGGAAYGRAPFVDNGNYSFSAPFTNGSWGAFSYISAVRESAGETVYVSIAIAAGWYDFPQYRVDVVQLKSNTGSIVSTGTHETEPTPAEQAASPGASADLPTQGGGFISDTGSFRVRAGIASFMFADPALIGGFVVSYDTGTETSEQASGFRDFFGPWAEVGWFPNHNLGFVVDAGFVASDHEDLVDGVAYSSSGEIIFVRAGTVVRAVGDEFPVTLGLGFGGGVAITTFYQSWTEDPAGQYFVAEDLFPVIHCSAELTIPVVSVGRVCAGLEYMYIPAGDFRLQQDGGSDYWIESREANLGGLSLRLGLVAEF